MKAVVLAAGEGIRLRPITYTRPKHLIPIGGKPLLEHTLTSLREAGLREILLIVHYKAEQIRGYFQDGSRLGLEIEYVHQPEISGTAAAVQMAEEYVDGEFLMIYGDLLTSTEAIRRVIESHRKVKPSATMALAPVEHPERYGVVTLDRDGFVTGIIEKPAPGTVKSNLINAGIFILPEAIFDEIRRTPLSPRGEREITDSLTLLVREGGRILGVKLESSDWLDLGRPWDLLEANRRVLSRMEGEVRGSIEDGAYVKGPVYIGDGATVRSGSYIEGPVYIGGGSDVGPNCRIHPYTSIGEDVRIGNASEVEGSIIMDGTRIGALSYIGYSIVGEGCAIGAGSITATIRFDSKTIRMRIKGQLVDSERTELGVVMGDNVKAGVGSIFMPGVRVGCNSWIGPNMVVYRDVPPNSFLTAEQSVTERERPQEG